MRSFVTTGTTLLFLAPCSVQGFGVQLPNHFPSTTFSTEFSSTSLRVFDPSSSSLDLWSIGQSIWVATIDADIDKIPQNEFATVFAGGIMVMVGGLLSAVVVGAILEKGDLYANLVAESYIRSGDDAEFWKSLSEEEKKKAEQMLSKIKQAKEDGGITDENELKDTVLAAINNENKATTSNVLSDTKQSKNTDVAKASNDIFSDYGD